MSAESAGEKKGLWSQIWVYVMIAITVMILIFYGIRFVGEDLALTITQDIIIALAAACSVVFLLVAYQFKWFNTRIGLIMTLLAIGFILWIAAEIIYNYQTVDFGGVADFFYIAGYVPIAIGLFLYIRTVKMKFKPIMLALWIGISAAVFVVVLIYEFIPFIAGGFIYPEKALLSWTVIYPAEDLILLVLALVLVFKFQSGEIAKPWLLVVVGVIMDVIGDIWFTYLVWYEYDMSAYDLYDLCFTMAYVGFLAAGLYFLWLYRKH
jgi:hypothetical protein